jgi:CBS domain-containing protein
MSSTNATSVKMQGVSYDQAIKKLFKGTKASNLATKDVKTVLFNDPASVVVKALIDGHISSVPVVDGEAKPMGFVDVLDITNFIMSCVTAKEKSPGSPKKKLTFNSNKWKNAKATDMMNFSHRNPFIVVREDADLTQVIKALVGAGAGHRALVVSSEGRMIGVVSQGDIVKLFFKNIDVYEVAKKTVKELKFGYCEVNRVLVTNQAYDGFERLARRNISGLAVVTEDGHTLYGNLSGSDIKNLGEDPNKTWERLKLSVKEYLEEHSKQTQPVFVLQSDTISDVAHKFSSTHVHRLFVADHPDRLNLIGVISLSDVIRMLHFAASQKRSTGLSGVKRKQSLRDSPKKEDKKAELEKKESPKSPKKDEKKSEENKESPASPKKDEKKTEEKKESPATSKKDEKKTEEKKESPVSPTKEDKKADEKKSTKESKK